MVGAGATVAVAVGVFFAVSASNAEEQTVPSTPNPSMVIESPEPTAVSSPIVMPEPVATPTPTPTLTPTPEVAVTKPAPAPVAPKPEPAAPLVQGTAPPAGSGFVVVQPGTVMPPAPEGVFYVPPPPPDPPLLP